MAATTLTIADTTIGKKYVMALTGAVLFGFLITHMLGNLQVFLGPAAINDYSKMLHGNPLLLWTARCVLIISVVAHIVTATQLTLLNRAARPVRYHVVTPVVTSYAARTMAWSGPLLGIYIVYHIAHLTLGYTAGLGYEHQWPDVYSHLIASFKVPWLTAIYVVAQLMLGLHLYHGAWSMFQSLGLSHRRYNEPLRSAAMAIAMAVVVGFLAVPAAINLGLVH